MTRTIIELDNTTINKIAAGEVIERPASVVKELTENSIDAKADRISIEVSDGGKKAITITDNGTGMSNEDALIAIKRHTTSKLRNADDLYNIYSLGFRGEALASIVTVAIVEIITRTQDDELGTRLLIEGGEIKIKEKISAPVGTKVTVRNLFFNVPVRKKFLKSTSTELKHITEIVTKLAISHPDIAITLKHNGKTIISAPKGDLLSNITSIFGRTLAKGAIKIDHSYEDYSLTGYILKPEFARKSRDYLYIFVNGRAIRDKLITDAILAGYGTTMPHSSFPVVFLNLSIPPSDLDVNIHPTKREVKFAREAQIFSLFEEAIRNAISASGALILERVKEPKKQPSIVQFGKRDQTEHYNTAYNTGKLPSNKNLYSHSTSAKLDNKSYSLDRHRTRSLHSFIPASELNIADSRKKEEISQQSEKDISLKIKVLGIIKNTYIIADTNEGLLLCDQHAAAEKLNYIRYIRQVENKKVSRQMLLSPTVITLKPSEFAEIKEIMGKLEEYGFVIEPFGETDIIIRTVPSVIGKIVSPETVRDIIDILKNYKDEIKNKVKIVNLGLIKDIVALKSCRSAIKAGDKLSVEEGERLIKELLEQDDPWTCPHGRPTMIILNEDYLEELFGRDYK